MHLKQYYLNTVTSYMISHAHFLGPVLLGLLVEVALPQLHGQVIP
jgi:hypothetical protein